MTDYRAARNVALLSLFLVLALLTSIPYWLQSASPSHTLRLESGLFTSDWDGRSSAVALPHAWNQRQGSGTYRIAFDLERNPGTPLKLFIPVLSQHLVATLNGTEIADTGNQSMLFGVTAGGPALIALPEDLMQRTGNVLDLQLTSYGLAKGYLSDLYIGTDAQLAAAYWQQTFLLVHLRLMIFAMQLLVLAVVLVAWLYRPTEALFGWLVLLLVTMLPSYLGLFPLLWPDYRDLLLYAFLASSAVGFVMPIVAMLVNGTRVPSWLQVAALVVPGCAVLAVHFDIGSAREVGLYLCTPLIVGAPLAAAAIAAWGALVRQVREAWMLLPALVVLGLASLHDLASAIGWLDNPVYLTIYYRPLLLLVIPAILMRRLGLSQKRLDHLHADLKWPLSQREAELARRHDAERRETAQRVRSQERQRLMVDLHDGLSGHLASIIALAERARAGDIERAAREALEDLRIVIHSLDIGDRELHVMLADYRGRIERQLKRLGIVLDWSIMNLPGVSGVTPTHALNVLRILQEAVTNAVKHGPATRVTVRGDTDSDGQAMLVIENDGGDFVTGDGLGLGNMRWRAEQLGGAIRVAGLSGGGARVVLTLPLQLLEQRDALDRPPGGMPRVGQEDVTGLQ